MTRRWRGATFEFTVKNPNGVEKGVIAATLNGKPVEGALKPQPEGSVNEVIVVMGNSRFRACDNWNGTNVRRSGKAPSILSLDFIE